LVSAGSPLLDPTTTSTSGAPAAIRTRATPS